MLALRAIFLLPVPPTVLLAAAAHIRMCQVERAPCAPLDTSVRLPVEFNLAILAGGVPQARRLAIFVMLATTAHFQSIHTRSHAPVVNILHLHHQHAPCAPPVVFAHNLETNDFLAQQEVFL